MEALPFCALPDSEAFDLDSLIKGDEAVDIADIWTIPDIRDQKGRRRLADVLLHAYEYGYL